MQLAQNHRQRPAADMLPYPQDEIAAAQASQVKNPTSWLCDSTHRFSPILRYTGDWETCVYQSPPPTPDWYEGIIASFEIDDFTPHCEDNGPCDGCIEDIACPDQ